MEMAKAQNNGGKVEVMGMTKVRGRWPSVLYMTPDKWSSSGEVFVVDERELRLIVRELRSLGEDWRKVSVKDATPIHLFRVDGYDGAVYKGGKFYKVWRYRFPDGKIHYDWCELAFVRGKNERGEEGQGQGGGPVR
jgi:hypothetical protein